MKLQTTILLVALILIMFASAGSASEGVLGKWEATVESRRGNSDIAMEFAAEDGGLRGTFTGRDGVETLEDVTYSGRTLNFTRNTESGGGFIALKYSAVVDGDTMDVTVETPRGERRFTAKRAD